MGSHRDFIAVKFSEMRFASGMVLIFLIVFLVNSLVYARYRIPIGYFGIVNSSYSQVVKDVKARMDYPSSFELFEFGTAYDDSVYSLHYIIFSGINEYGERKTESLAIYYYQDDLCKFDF